MKVRIYIQNEGKGPFNPAADRMEYGKALAVINNTIMSDSGCWNEKYNTKPQLANTRIQLLPAPHKNCLPVNSHIYGESS